MESGVLLSSSLDSSCLGLLKSLPNSEKEARAERMGIPGGCSKYLLADSAWESRPGKELSVWRSNWALRNTNIYPKQGRSLVFIKRLLIT
ncbi:hypothetical protein TNCV_987991 [Trichonephila clavipes]|nr:hypothetical protein TNCV_987991 [Trichonephila clavipes]